MITTGADTPSLVIALVVREVTNRGSSVEEKWMIMCVHPPSTKDSWFERTPALRKISFLLAQTSVAILLSKAVNVSELTQILVLAVYAMFGIKARQELILWRLLETVYWRWAMETSSLGRSRLST